MGTAPVRFGGRELYKPGFYAERIFVPFSSGGATASIAIAIGESTKGIPYNAADKSDLEKINWITDLTTCRNLGRGAGFDYVRFALTPSNDPSISGASLIGFIRVNPATHSTKTIKDKDAADVLVLSAADYGLHTEQVAFKVEAGTTVGRKITVNYDQTIVAGDNITNGLFTITYTGTAVASILALDPVGNLTTACTAVPVDNLSLALTSYTTVGTLVAAINAFVGTGGAHVYTAAVVGDSSFLTAKLDKLTAPDAVDLKTPTVYTVRAELQACIDWINESSVYMTAAHATVPTRRTISTSLYGSYTYLTGGVDGTVTNTEWNASITLSEKFDASFVGIATGTAAVHSSLAASVAYMCGVDGRNERQGFCGATTAAVKATRMSEAVALNSPAMNYCASPFYRYNDATGDLTLYDGFYLSAIEMGMFAGNALNFCPTFKTINAVNIKELYSATDLKDYITSGVVVLEPAPGGGFRFVRAVTTTTKANIAENEATCQREAFFITKDMRVRTEAQYIGLPGTNVTIQSMATFQRDVLLRDYEEKYELLVVDPALGNSFRGYTYSVVGDTFKSEFEATLVVPVNFALCRQNFVVIGQKR